MKKLFVTVLAILASGAAYALPVGNPSEASLLYDGLFFEGSCGDPCDPCLSFCDAFSFRAGFYGDYVFNRHMEVGDNDVVDSGPDIEHFQLFTNAGYLAVNFWDRFDVFTSLGVTQINLDTNLTAFNPAIATGEVLELETDSHFSWSIGGRATIWECGCTSFGIEGQYFRTNPNIRRVTRAAVASVYPDDTLNGIYSEWQVGLGLSHRINMFVPYVAVKYARSHFDIDTTVVVLTGVPATLVDLQSKKRWGFATGVSLVDCEKAAVTVEGRFGDEKALYVNGQIRF